MAKEVLIDVKDLAIDFKTPNGVFEAVRDVSFEIEKGKTLALVGESGSGKSITALSILQLLPYPMASHPKGEIVIDDENVVGMSERRIRKIRGNKVGMIFQEPMTSLNPLHNIEKQISEPLFLHRGYSKKQAKERVLELLDLVGLPMLKTRLGAFPHELSGGQRQRVMIAMALANEPDILIADEPTTALDVTVQAQILDLLLDIQKKLGMAILLITHDFGVVKKMAHKVCVMKKGQIVEKGLTKTVFSKPKHDYTKMLLDSEPSGSPKAYNKKAPPILRGENVKVSFVKDKTFFGRAKNFVHAVNDISLDLKPGETLGIVGESGSGKTTLAMALLKLIGSEGRIKFEERELSNLSSKEMRALRSDFQVVFQDPYGSLSPRMTVAQIIAEGLTVHEPNLKKKERDARVVSIMEEVGLDPETRHRYPHEFSGGQRQRISIARAMILKPKVVLLDEPTSALDLSVQSQIVDLLRNLQKEYELSYLFISHDLKVVRAMSHNVMVMKDGKVVEQGTVKQIFDKPKTDYTKGLIKAAFEMESAA